MIYWSAGALKFAVGFVGFYAKNKFISGLKNQNGKTEINIHISNIENIKECML